MSVVKKVKKEKKEKKKKKDKERDRHSDSRKKTKKSKPSGSIGECYKANFYFSFQYLKANFGIIPGKLLQMQVIQENN